MLVRHVDRKTNGVFPTNIWTALLGNRYLKRGVLNLNKHKSLKISSVSNLIDIRK